jgi:hypothetical protein
MSQKKTAATKSSPQKEQHAHVTGRFKIDARAHLIKNPEAVNDDDLMTTAEVASWLSVSRQWLEIGRNKNYGPPFVRIGPGVIMYRRDTINKWLRERE